MPPHESLATALTQHRRPLALLCSMAALLGLRAVCSCKAVASSDPTDLGLCRMRKKFMYELYGTSPTNIWSSQLSGQKS